jgi:hypothetical protein
VGGSVTAGSVFDRISAGRRTGVDRISAGRRISGNRFVARRTTARYCGGTCRMRAHKTKGTIR